MARSKPAGAGAKAPSQRQLRVGEEIRHVLSEIFAHGDLRDPVLAEASITVTEVRPSPDLRNATVFVMPLAGSHAAEVADALNHAAGYLRGLLGKRIHLRYTPSLVFTVDRSYDEAARVDALLHDERVARDLEHREEDGDADAEAPPRRDGDGA